MSERTPTPASRRYRARAEECRIEAEFFRDPKARTQISSLLPTMIVRRRKQRRSKKAQFTRRSTKLHRTNLKRWSRAVAVPQLPQPVSLNDPDRSSTQRSGLLSDIPQCEQ